jgi:hypothetical protein
LARREPTAVAVAQAAAAVARAVRRKRPDEERQARIDLARAHARVFQLKAAGQLALAQKLEDEGRKAEPPVHG